MIKKIIGAKITSTITTETIVIGLKLVDSEGHLLKMFGTGLALLSATLLLVCWANHGESTVTAAAPATVATTKRARKNARSSRTSRSTLAKN